ncbi:MAG: shikimate kinase [Verrucomicrobiae bacterium]|nr:shikimate kinase [Verrucomicrobiae bacterium]NNJ43740.1 shikimate kinase [Akkermansiaceae bacterium]
MHNIVLIGFMGCGKSTIGRELNKKLGYRLLDTDHSISQETGKTIPEIFQQDGEDHFRSLETQLLENLLIEKTNHQIISTGGGMISRPENPPLLRQLGFVVWLSCTPDDIFSRTSRNSNRPLLQCDDPMAVITQLLEERAPLYEQTAHLEINTSDLDFDEISCGILESARYHFGSLPAPR